MSDIPEAQYKELQRKYDRRDKTAKQAEKRIVELEAGMSRVEGLLESLTGFLAGEDAQLKPVANRMVEENQGRRQKDRSAAELQSKLNQVLDESDADWDDPRFEKAREVMDTINESGDLSRGYEVERLIREAVSGNSESGQAAIDTAVAAALAAERNNSRRVDTGEGTSRPGQVTRQDLTFNPSAGVGDLKARLAQAMDQLTK